MTIGGGKWVENTHIKESSLTATHPETICRNVEPGSIFDYRRGTVEGFAREWLQGWLDANIIADFRQPASHCVPDLVVSDGGEATFGAGERMFHRGMGPTGTISRSIGGKPTIPQGQSISKDAFVEGEAELFKW